MNAKTKQALFLPFLIMALIASVIGALLTSAPPTHAAGPWYVNDATGNDSNDCATPATACKTIDAAIGKASADDTVIVAAGVYTENITLSKNIVISGAGSDAVYIDGSQSGYVFNIGSGLNVTLQDVTVRNGSISGSGGGIYNTGILTITNSVLADNQANYGGAIMVESGGSLFMQDVTIRDNTATAFGGGLFLQGGGSITIERSTISGNQAGSSSGGFHAQDNVAVQLTNVTISGNSSDNKSAFAVASGATIYVRNSTIANNNSTGSGGNTVAISNYGTVDFQNSIVANSSGNDSNCFNGSSMVSLGYNLSDDATCLFTQTGDVQNSDPQLGALADNGGQTETHALLVGSPAIDSGTNSGCAAVDQRGATRPFDGDNDGTATCDKGAYEFSNQLSIADTSVLEGDSSSVTAVFTVTLVPTSTQPITVTYATTDDTAAAGSDYTAISGTLVFAPNEGSKTLNVAVLGDTDDEPDETFFVNLSSAQGAQVMDGQAVGQIVDDDGLPSLVIADTAVTEGDSGTTTAVFTVTLSPSSAQSVSVQYATADGTASAGSDYTAAAGTLTFTPGQTTRTVSVTVQGDVIDESSAETFTVHLINPTNAAIQDDAATGTITDDDTAALSVPDITANEGYNAVFTVTLSTPSAFTVTVDYATQDVTAVAGVDYVAASGTITLTPGETAQAVSVPTLDNGVVDSSLYFYLRLSNAHNATIADDTGTCTIIDASEAGAFQFSQAAFTVQENGSTATITVERVNGFFGAVSVDYATSDGTATAGSDYTAASGTLNFANGETHQTFTVTILNDAVQEGDETVNLTISNPTGGATIGSPSHATLTIQDTVANHYIYLPLMIKP